MIYLDNASTTKPSEGVKKAVIDAMENFGNPSSMHRLGIDSEKIIKNAAENVSKVLGVRPENIYFTSGGTESNNTAILGYCRKNKKRGNHVITTKIEHPSVMESFKKLEDEGFCVSYIGVDENGIIKLDEFENALREDTIFVSCMWVNNETGSIQPVEKLKNIMKSRSPKAVLHADAVQAFGKIECKPKKYGVDMLSLSAHKIHGIKGCGALYVDNVNIDPYIIGGAQQKNMRSGTENVVGIAGLGQAAAELNVEKDREYVSELRSLLESGIRESIEDIKINGEHDNSGYVLNVSFRGVKAEILLHSLERYDIFVSTGSACSTNKPMPSHVLSAMGCDKREIDGAVRFSLGNDLKKEDIYEVISALKKETAQIRKYVR